MNQLKSPYGDPQELDEICECVGKGWHKIVESLVEDLFDLGWDGEVHQVKEKFGGLRFYIGRGTPEMFARIHLAEEQSYITCEMCGSPGRQRNDSWIKVRCDACEIEHWRELAEEYRKSYEKTWKEVTNLRRQLRG